MTTARILEARTGSVLTFREDLLTRTPAPELTPFEGQRFQVTRVTAEGIFGQAVAIASGEVLSPEFSIGLDEDLFKLSQVSHPAT